MSGLEKYKNSETKICISLHLKDNGLASWLGTTNFQYQALNQHSSTRSEYSKHCFFLKQKWLVHFQTSNQSHCIGLMYAQFSILQLQFTQDSDLIFLKDVVYYCIACPLFCISLQFPIGIEVSLIQLVQSLNLRHFVVN